jgi:hypothetical protein
MDTKRLKKEFGNDWGFLGEASIPYGFFHTAPRPKSVMR